MISLEYSTLNTNKSDQACHTSRAMVILHPLFCSVEGLDADKVLYCVDNGDH